MTTIYAVMEHTTDDDGEHATVHVSLHSVWRTKKDAEETLVKLDAGTIMEMELEDK